uniref:Putative calpain n=1 Tax=Trypanosoma congolense (strain IL3000) TaxID=1068625 RepID=G0UJ02_TRYCI|nr:putative calpain [Trypanosoma congolense IL3000]
MGCGASSANSAVGRDGVRRKQVGIGKDLLPLSSDPQRKPTDPLTASPAVEKDSLGKKKAGEEFFDEFGELTVVALPQGAERDSKYKCGQPMVTGDEVKPCFDNGLLYRIVKGDTWAFYNDTRVYEMCVSFTFGKDSVLRALGNTVVTTQEDGTIVAEASVYPCETVMFVKGRFTGFQSKIKAQPLSDDALKGKAKQYEKYIMEELARVKALAGNCEDDDIILTRCIQESVPYIDVNFPPVQASLERGSVMPIMTIPWARPDMYLPLGFPPHVRLFRSSTDTVSVEQGDLGDYWVMCAIASLEDHPDRLRTMFKHPLSADNTPKERAVGACRVTLNKSGWWKSVIVDDYLPVVGNRPKFAQSLNDPCELWVSILQKAYAKLHGSYVNIASGDPLHALQDFTGYASSRYDHMLGEDSETSESEVLEQLEKYYQKGYKIIFSTPTVDVEKEEHQELVKNNGLLLGHAYPVKSVRYFTEKNIALMCIRNPWHRDTQWKGEWSKDDEAWKVHPEIAEACDIAISDDSCFWMSWSDVRKHFVACGVVFRMPTCTDYRIRGTFQKGIPNVCVLITVSKTTTIMCTMTQEDRRGTGRVYEYPPIMMSLCCRSRIPNDMEVERSTTTEADFPSEEFVFIQSRDVSMICTLTPFKSPYMLVPRILEEADEEKPYVIGLQSETEFGVNAKVDFVSLPSSSPVFKNRLSFPVETESVEAQFQVWPPEGRFPFEYRSTCIAKNKRGDGYVLLRKK